MNITVLAGGVGGAKFLRGVRATAAERWPDGSGGTTASITAIVNTGDDAWVTGLRVTPDLDSVLYALAGANDEERGWGRAGESERVSAELTAYGVGWPWFTLGDLDLGTHIARTAWLREGLPLSAVVERISARWPLGVRLLPMTDDEVETLVEVDAAAVPDALTGGPGAEGIRRLHFQEWWTRYRAKVPATAFVQPGVEAATPAPGVLDAIRTADVVLVAPSNPVVSIGTILAVPGVREALATTTALVVGVSPIIGDRPVRGMADACLPVIGVETTAAAVALHYGPRRLDGRSVGGLLDGWLVDSTDSAAVGRLVAAGIPTSARPLLMTDIPASAAIASAAIDLASR